MSLAPDDQQVLDMMKVAGRPPVPVLPEEARRMYRASRAALQPEIPDLAELRDLSAPGPVGFIPLRLYRGIGTERGPLLAVLTSLAISIGTTMSAARSQTSRNAAKHDPPGIGPISARSTNVEVRCHLSMYPSANVFCVRRCYKAAALFPKASV